MTSLASGCTAQASNAAPLHSIIIHCNKIMTDLTNPTNHSDPKNTLQVCSLKILVSIVKIDTMFKAVK